MKKKQEPESLYLSKDFQKRFFPQEAKHVDMRFEETPLFKAQAKAKAEGKQLTLFEKGDKDHEASNSETLRDKAL